MQVGTPTGHPAEDGDATCLLARSPFIAGEELGMATTGETPPFAGKLTMGMTAEREVAMRVLGAEWIRSAMRDRDAMRDVGGRRVPWVAACIAAWMLAAPAPAPAAGVGHFPHIEVDPAAGEVRVECEALAVDLPLEFFCVLRGTSEHESALRTLAVPEQIHAGLLMLGLKPGQPVRWSASTDTWQPPSGPALHIDCEYEREGKRVRIPAYRLMRDVKTKKPMPPLTWVFVGSKMLDDGQYAANATGYVVSVVNFDLTVIDIPQLASSANETLEWELDPTTAPPKGSAVTMILSPAGSPGAATRPTTETTTEPTPGAKPEPTPEPTPGPTTPPTTAPAPATEATVGGIDLEALRKQWETAVLPHRAAIADAAKAHRDAIALLRARQQALIDEADELQRLIDRLERQYQDMLTPPPSDRP